MAPEFLFPFRHFVPQGKRRQSIPASAAERCFAQLQHRLYTPFNLHA